MKKLILLSLVLAGCASNSKSVKELDTKLEAKGAVLDGTLGLNDKQEPIIQIEKPAENELRNTIWQNNELESQLNHETAYLSWCREDLADPRLGGSGDVIEIPEIDNMKPATDLKSEMGLVGGRLVVLSKESFIERLDSEKRYQTSLETMLKTVKKIRKKCERDMGMARRKAGLPSNRYQGQITVTPEGKVGQVLAPHENNLDDAFKIKAGE